jgi:hypothetical protein
MQTVMTAVVHISLKFHENFQLIQMLLGTYKQHVSTSKTGFPSGKRLESACYNKFHLSWYMMFKETKITT